MNWLNVSCEDLRKRVFTASDNATVGVWLRLATYCASQENGGLIKNCRGWTDRQWLIAAGVESKDVQAPSDLWRWTDADNLIIEHYPAAQEAVVKIKRAAAVATAEKRRQKKEAATRSANSSANRSARTEEKEEGKSKRNGTTSYPRLTSPRPPVEKA